MPERFAGWEDSGLPPSTPGTVVTVGTFDGVHRGHWDVLSRIAARGKAGGLASVLVTFEPHPLEIVNPAAAPPLLTLAEEKVEVVAESGVDFMAIVPFTPQLRAYSAAQFVDEVLRRRFHVRELVIGHDHGFGRGREGDVDVMRALGAARGFGVEVVAAVATGDGRPISSTMIRRAVAGGDLAHARAALGRLYSVSGVVRPGAGRGRTLGYPTINVPIPPPRLQRSRALARSASLRRARGFLRRARADRVRRAPARHAAVPEPRGARGAARARRAGCAARVDGARIAD
jgi:riboflavin kinase/FMN adenylyltransferase